MQPGVRGSSSGARPASIAHSAADRPIAPPSRIAQKSSSPSPFDAIFSRSRRPTTSAHLGNGVLRRFELPDNSSASTASDGGGPPMSASSKGITISARPENFRHPSPEPLVVRISRFMFASRFHQSGRPTPKAGRHGPTNEGLSRHVSPTAGLGNVRALPASATAPRRTDDRIDVRTKARDRMDWLRSSQISACRLWSESSESCWMLSLKPTGARLRCSQILPRKTYMPGTGGAGHDANLR